MPVTSNAAWGGLLGGLWEFPTVPVPDLPVELDHSANEVVLRPLLASVGVADPSPLAADSATQMGDLLGGSGGGVLRGVAARATTRLRYRGRYVHKFSHITLTVDVYYLPIPVPGSNCSADLPDSDPGRPLRWVTRHALDGMALPALTRRVFRLAVPQIETTAE